MPLKFKRVDIPGAGSAYIPDDINLVFPETTAVTAKELHYLAFIPWDKKYLSYVPAAYREFFGLTLPYLHARTTDVHTAICLPLVKRMFDVEPADSERVVYLGLILHDSGWSKLTEKQIADSLSYSGLILSEQAHFSKALHATEGANIAKKLLDDYEFEPNLSQSEKEAIIKIVLYHDVEDIPEGMVESGEVPRDVYVVADIDRFWSYTHENFWQDTVRKGVEPSVYWQNLKNDLVGYFFTDGGRKIARELLEDRKQEVEQCPN